MELDELISIIQFLVAIVGIFLLIVGIIGFSIGFVEYSGILDTLPTQKSVNLDLNTENAASNSTQFDEIVPNTYQLTCLARVYGYQYMQSFPHSLRYFQNKYKLQNY